jgi:hypothetical protein
MLDSAKCSKSIGFDVQIKNIFVNAKDVKINFEHHGFDNRVIALVEKYIAPRVPGLIQKAITEQVNPLISNYTCTRVEEQIQIKGKDYVLILNTTEVPAFNEGLNYLRAPVDLTLINMVTNETNNELERDDLPDTPDLSIAYDVAIGASSNLLNTVMWLVGDA